MRNDLDAFERIIHDRKSPLNFSVIIINIIVFIAVTATGGTDNITHMLDAGAAYTPYILNGEWHRLFTSMFLHFGFLHIAGNMLLLFFIGDYAERFLGKIRYLVLYIGGGLIGNLASFALELSNGDYSVSAGASGAVFAVLGGLAAMAIKNGGRLYDISIRNLIVLTVLQIIFSVTTVGIDAAAHAGGLAGGFVICIIELAAATAVNKRRR